MTTAVKRPAHRPPSDNKATLLITIKATTKQKAKFLELGGSRWVKRLLDDASKPKRIISSARAGRSLDVLQECIEYTRQINPGAALQSEIEVEDLKEFIKQYAQ